MLNLKSFVPSGFSKAMLMSFSLMVAGMPIAMAEHHTTDEKTTAFEESNAPVSDSWITTKVKAELLANEDVKGLDINVSTTNGVVTLAGVLDTRAQIASAIDLARGVKGVASVDSKALKVKPAM
jgi:hyperosmotically inducible periplasmic protein